MVFYIQVTKVFHFETTFTVLIGYCKEQSMTMDNKDKRAALINIRPQIPSITEQHSSSEVELFQNKSLRPILKFQNDLLVALFKDYIVLRKGKYHQLVAAKKSIFIADSIKKDQKFKYLLLGTIIGHLTSQEYQFYQENRGELNRRIATLLIQRLQDQLLNSNY